jgi:hypothetical protein
MPARRRFYLARVEGEQDAMAEGNRAIDPGISRSMAEK